MAKKKIKPMKAWAITCDGVLDTETKDYAYIARLIAKRMSKLSPESVFKVVRVTITVDQ